MGAIKKAVLSDMSWQRGWRRQFKKNRFYSWTVMVRLWWRNRSCGASCVESGGTGPVVSMTSYGRRLSQVFLALESIAQGDLLPRRLILALDDELRDSALPASVMRLQARGLEVIYGPRVGPHQKYFAWLEREPEFNVALVTADDDVLYPTWWLSLLWESHLEAPSLIHCFRAHLMSFEEGGVAPYRRWSPCCTAEPSPLHFATGVSGVIYPVAMLGALKREGDKFRGCCPDADDIWLHVTALRNGVEVKQVFAKALHFVGTQGSQQWALHRGNVVSDGNDHQIAETYQAADIALLRQAYVGAG